ncbi:30S ribosomal protein S7 [Candidatus Woesearchaeota archaeon]|nr:30S ribosomal protein S7 [Candidatus Woesearchaeota archaeon]
MTEIKLYNRWSTEGIKVQDPGLGRYITLEPVLVPKTGARYAGQKFHKSKINIVERLINKLMVSGHKGKKHVISSGHNTGKAAQAYRTVEEAFIIIERRTKKNPIKVLIEAIEAGAPREEIITIEYGGARYPKAVEMAPQRRIDHVLRLIAQSAYQKAFNAKKSAAETLATEIISAHEYSAQSTLVAKKLELERQADASR